MIHNHIPHLLWWLSLWWQLYKKLFRSYSSFSNYFIDAFNNLIIDKIGLRGIIFVQLLCPIERNSILLAIHFLYRVIILLFQPCLALLSKVPTFLIVNLTCFWRCLAQIVFVSVFIIPFLHLLNVWVIIATILIDYVIHILFKVTVRP